MVSKVYSRATILRKFEDGGSVDFYIYPFWVNTTSKFSAAVHKCPLNQIENGFQIRDRHSRIDLCKY
jgi:hypothetical protein